MCRVATAEAGYNSKEAQTNVVCAVMNRVASKEYPNSVKEVIYQSGQFACVRNGAFDKVTVTEKTKQNVLSAYGRWQLGKYNAEGAKYFTRGSFNRTYLFTDEVGHNFYK